jgi:hypothetical protein
VCGRACEGRDSPNADAAGDVRDCGGGIRHHGFGDFGDRAAVRAEHDPGGAEGWRGAAESGRHRTLHPDVCESNLAWSRPLGTSRIQDVDDAAAV